MDGAAYDAEGDASFGVRWVAMFQYRKKKMVGGELRRWTTLNAMNAIANPGQ
jgi:hypothetical protein